MSTRRPHRSLLVLVALLALVMSVWTAPPAVAASRVIGGTKVGDDGFSARWSFIVTLGFKSARTPAAGHFCGGVLIAERLVLTARHCVESAGWNMSPSDIRVTSGSPSLRTRLAAANVVAIHRTPEAPGTWFTTNADLAILQLDGPLTTNTTVASLARPEHAGWWGAGSGRVRGVHVAGWGITRDADIRHEVNFGPSALDLQQTELPVLSSARCAAIVPNDPSVTRHICAGRLENRSTAMREGRTACYGDSGGPLLASDPAGVEPGRVIGIVSRGAADECSSGPGIYVNVADRAAWIDSVIAQASSTTLRSGAPLFWSQSNLDNTFTISSEQSVEPTDAFLVELQPPGTRGWRQYGAFVGARKYVVGSPTRTGFLNVRVRRVVDGIEQPEARPFRAVVKRDLYAPWAPRRLTAVRHGYVHQLAWSPAIDYEDRVVAYYIEQRVPRGRWQYEAYLECSRCWTSNVLAPLRSSHVLLPGRRQFRISAVDRAGNWSYWTYSR